MPGGLAERAVIAALHQGEPARRVVADRGDPLLSPRRGRNPRVHTNRIPRSSQAASAEGSPTSTESSTRVGYTGGENDNPTADNHPGPAEAVEVIFDPERTSHRAAGAIRPSEMYF